MINNLLNNAVKYSSDGGAVAVRLDESRGGVRIEVEDRGMGISPNEIRKIFTKFFRASNAIREKTKGTGLGLALVKAIVEGHGGKVNVTSELGKGSVFTVEFPLIPSNPAFHNGG